MSAETRKTRAWRRSPASRGPSSGAPDVGPAVRRLRGSGSSAAQVLDAVAAIAVPLLAGSAFQVTAAALDDPFRPQAWTPRA